MKKEVSESKIESHFTDYARGKRCKSYKFVSPGNNGVPDRLVAVENGRLFLIEFKRLGKKRSPYQARQKVTLNRMGIPVYLCDEIGQAENLLDTILELPEVNDWPKENHK